MEILCFFSGVAFVYSKSIYPLMLVLIILFFRPNLIVIGWFCLAIFWSVSHQWWIADQHMPSTAILKNAVIEGYIESIPSLQGNKTQFQFRLEDLNGQSVKANVLLACYDHCPEVQAGQHWTMQATLKKPRNLANPGGFDYIAWLKARHISWTATARTGSFKRIETPANVYSLLMLRQHLGAIQAQMDPDPVTLGILQALTLGMTSFISKESWDLFRHTGTTHLMVISGAHIGLVAGLSYWLVRWIWCRLGSACLLYPAPKVASIAALLMAFIYALLAGFGAPAQRSLIACFFMFIRHFCSRRFSVWQGWRYALLAVLLFEPHSVMMPGFYLSFLAVGILLVVNQRLLFTGIKKTISMQLACLFGLMPLTLYWFSYGATNGFIANLIAIPWVGFIIVPLSLLTTLLSPWIVLPWAVIGLKTSILYLLKYLSWVDSFSLFNLTFSVTELLPPIAIMIAMSMLLLMPLKQLLPALVILFSASFFQAHEKVKDGDAQIDVLDVGEGLAVVVRTAHHVLIYDTGAKFYHGSDMGKLVIIPYLNATNVAYIDKVVISHSDLDHRGGLLSLEEKYKIHELIVDDPTFYKRGKNCHYYPSWRWDGVTFRFFAITKLGASKNNQSCILKVSTNEAQLLLSGDIEKPAEQYLETTYGTQLSSSVLLVPHHGSKTSSSSSFIEQVAPQYAIVSFGFDNRYHFPHQQAMQIYQQRQIELYNTADCGMVRLELKSSTPLTKPTCYR